MFQFPLHNGRHYLTLNEASERLGISKEDVLYNLANEALIYLKCRAVAKSDFNDNDYDIEAIKWIEGLFWLPVDAYVELRFLLNNEITSISFSELRPHSIFVLNTGYFNGDATQRCHVTCEDWLYVKYPDVADFELKCIDELYFWEDTVEGFAEQNGFNYVVPEHLLSLDVVAKNILQKNSSPTTQQLVDENEALKAKVAELEQRLSEYKKLTTQTKNKVMPIIYGLCCLYGNKGNPLIKSRASCESIASELMAKFGIEIGDKGLENYYNAGRDILGKEK